MFKVYYIIGKKRKYLTSPIDRFSAICFIGRYGGNYRQRLQLEKA